MPYITETTTNQVVETKSKRSASDVGFLTCVEESLQWPLAVVSDLYPTAEPETSQGNMSEAVVEVQSDREDLSRTPSPISSRASSPRRSAMPCPDRLTSLIPPVNYGSVHRNAVFRSGFPQAKNIGFLEGLHIRSILTLVDTASSEEYSTFIEAYGLRQKVVSIAANKDGKVKTTTESICEALAFILDPSNHPVYVHCNQGRHRTGCVIACLRRVQQWPLEEAISEYQAYASPKARAADIEFITAFQPESLVSYAREPEAFSWSQRKPECTNDVYELAAMVLPAHDIVHKNSPHDSVLNLDGVKGYLQVQASDLPPPVVDADSPINYGVTIIDYALAENVSKVASPIEAGPFMGGLVVEDFPEDLQAEVSEVGRSERPSLQARSSSLGTPSTIRWPVPSIGA